MTFVRLQGSAEDAPTSSQHETLCISPSPPLSPSGWWFYRSNLWDGQALKVSSHVAAILRSGCSSPSYPVGADAPHLPRSRHAIMIPFHPREVAQTRANSCRWSNLGFRPQQRAHSLKTITRRAPQVVVAFCTGYSQLDDSSKEELLLSLARCVDRVFWGAMTP